MVTLFQLAVTACSLTVILKKTIKSKFHTFLPTNQALKRNSFQQHQPEILIILLLVDILTYSLMRLYRYYWLLFSTCSLWCRLLVGLEVQGELCPDAVCSKYKTLISLDGS